MKPFRKSVVQDWVSPLALSLVFIAGCHGTQVAKTDPEIDPAVNPPATWALKMQALSQALSELLPLVAVPAHFDDPKNAETIDRDVGELEQLAHSLKTTTPANLDPTMPIVGGLFTEDVKRAREGLKNGNRDYARSVLKDTMAYCIQCHTQTANGPEFPRMSLNVTTADLNPLERAEFFTATRQFDRAMAAYSEVLRNEALAKTDPFKWERAARQALAIDVRVKRDPKSTLSLVRTLESNHYIPSTTRKAVRSWRKGLKEWSQEKDQTLVAGPEQLLKAQQLILKARARQKFPLDHTQDILYFRAAGLLHELLSGHRDHDELTAQALLNAGLTAEATRDMNLWTLHESYYEVCVGALPHSQTAQECWEHLKNSLTEGYSGSGGVKIPPAISARLEEFRKQAQPETRDDPSEAPVHPSRSPEPAVQIQ